MSKSKARKSPIRRDISAEYLWMLVTDDEYECPVCVCKSFEDLCDKLGRTQETLHSSISRNSTTIFNGQRCRYKVLKVGPKRKRKLNILLIRAGEEPKFMRINNSDKAIAELIGGYADYHDAPRNNVIISGYPSYEGPLNQKLFGTEYHGTLIVAGISDGELTDVRLSEATLPLFMKMARS